MTERDLTDQGRRLERARERLRAALDGGDVNEHLLSVAKLIQEIARDELAEKLGEQLQLLLGAVQNGRQDLREALLAYEDALTDRVTAIIVNRDLADLETQRRNTRRLDGLESWAYGGTITVQRVPPPGHDDEQEDHP